MFFSRKIEKQEFGIVVNEFESVLYKNTLTIFPQCKKNS